MPRDRNAEQAGDRVAEVAMAEAAAGPLTREDVKVVVDRAMADLSRQLVELLKQRGVL